MKAGSTGSFQLSDVVTATSGVTSLTANIGNVAVKLADSAANVVTLVAKTVENTDGQTGSTTYGVNVVASSKGDSFTSSAGNDTISLGTGADTFVFVADNGADTIKNFGDTDKLNVTALTGAFTEGDFISAVTGTTLASNKIIYAESDSAQSEANVTNLFVDAAEDGLEANKIKLAENVSSALLAVKFNDATGLYSVTTTAEGKLAEDGVQLVGTITASDTAVTLTAASFGLTTE